MNKIEKDYLGVVVLGLFNAASGVSDIREDLYYEETVRQFVAFFKITPIGIASFI